VNTRQVIKPSFRLEENHDAPVCGIDEAGRGPLAGPVVAACVYLPASTHDHDAIGQINDSKKLTEKRRNALYDFITGTSPHGVGIVSAEEIDTLNIHNATLLAMRRAFLKMCDRFEIKPGMALVDGNFVPDLPCAGQAVKKGDSISLSIAAASVIAKVTRDRIMHEAHHDYPVYGWNRNAGYGTPQHLEGLKIHGITPHHRRSFAPIKNIAQN